MPLERSRRLRVTEEDGHAPVNRVTEEILEGYALMGTRATEVSLKGYALEGTPVNELQRKASRVTR